MPIVRPPSALFGASRRDFLKVGSLAFSGINLTKLLAASEGSERSCIVLFQAGGASQLDTFDPKPEAVSDIRGSFKAIPTALPGVRVSELLPRSAKALNKFSIIRSMHSDEAIHERARQYVFSGTKPRNEVLQPSYGATLAKELGPKNGLPPFVSIPMADLSAEAGFLGPTFDPFVSGEPTAEDFSVQDLTLPGGINLSEARSRTELLGALNREFQRVEQSPLIDSMDEFYQKAFDLISSPAAKQAFDISAEPDELRDAYGRTTIGQGALLARRLVEAGVRLASVFQWGYDTHVNNEPEHKKLVPEFDRAFVTLLEDLEQRGLLDSTLVLVIGDFGRTPKINFSGGRDHWPGAFSVALAGAGIQGGAVIGETDGHAAEPIRRPVSIEDLGATVYEALGIDYRKNYHANGRPIAINKEGQPVEELWS
ncbi:MAG: DUF1501 domain-containing protein [Acidobacteriia bacterium]|nr:DUF1501 domain-containing protein [Terriglobia bacterium]MYB52247.1 DUF1501 domain-containing protein [Terriglobia bacterium]MYK09904.1 DUF1501 domain-containing protein [Terriglobia bacterium]